MSRSTSSADDVERARELVRKYIRLGVKFVVGKNVYAEWMKDEIAAALTAAHARGRAEMREMCLHAVRHIPPCPFDGPTKLRPEDPCPVCGDLGEITDDSPRCPRSKEMSDFIPLILLFFRARIIY
jgi:hypothetical protein